MALVSPIRHVLPVLAAIAGAVGIGGPPARATTATAVVGQAVTISVAVSGTTPFRYQWFKNAAALASGTGASYLLSNVTTADAGTYYVVVSNSTGSATSDNAVLAIQSAAVVPVITTQPTSKTVAVGSSVTFTSAATGVPSPTYQWRKNGTNISGATSASYTIASVTTASAGTYSVKATNAVGSATSNGAVLTVDIPPAITTQPASKKVLVGASVTFTAAASGTPAPTYQWRKNGTNIAGATSASYTIASVTTGSAGTYSVKATNSVGSATSNGAVLSVAAGGASGTASAQLLSQPLTATTTMATGPLTSSLAPAAPAAPPSAPPAGDWQVAAIGDFTGDGQADLLWRNLATNDYEVWTMNGVEPVIRNVLNTHAPDWRVVAIGDFNGDGATDILWFDPLTGEFDLWTSAGASAAANPSPGAVPAVSSVLR